MKSEKSLKYQGNSSFENSKKSSERIQGVSII